ncbi:MBL fold metallo-hydrolase [Streptomyces sp. HNM0574]|uniref:MBL fold metallo-hydrolase n=1 Tax=Streptomyces sp. HNM0574 TaxID=2714954 RepID=UPI00146C0D45|nr:MBL fold metallo-hydrolase [Streptomyces sp. HNM0574]NLU69374.1 MBL fold metallo-hydrolase [Streptomyces sp. HNM0574]
MSASRGARPLSFGAEPSGARLARIERSPHYDRAAGRFRNPEPAPDAPAPTGTRGAMARALLRRAGRRPAGEIPVRRPDLSVPPSSGLRLTWFGHSTVLAEIDGRRVLFDPVWGMRCSPFSFVGPRRMHRPPLPLRQLGPVDAVVISHDHYDHLDLPTVRALAGSGTFFAVPLGVGAHLERWGVPGDRFTELDWYESVDVAGLTLTATPARHFCGRGIRNRQRTLWASWTVTGPEHRVFHSGDTGYFPGFADIGEQYGPFDATMIQIGAYSEFWPDIHMTPEEGLRAHLDLTRADSALLPIHWGTFNLAPHPWGEPGERTLAAAGEAGVRVAAPVPGGSFEPAQRELPVHPWWRECTVPGSASKGTGGAGLGETLATGAEAAGEAATTDERSPAP